MEKSPLIIDCINDNGDVYYHTSINADKRSGILNFTHEIDLFFNMFGDKLMFRAAEELNCGGICSYHDNERSAFEEFHPGLLDIVETRMNDGTVIFR